MEVMVYRNSKIFHSLKEWDDWLAEYERWQIIYFKADSLAPLVLMRRYLLRMKQFLDDIKDERNKVKNAKEHYKNT